MALQRRYRKEFPVMPLALITGASRGLGRALARALAERDWSLVLDARGVKALDVVQRELPSAVVLAGDVADPQHREQLAAAVSRAGQLDLLVLPLMAEHAAIVNISSDAAVEAYEGWGGYGSAKAALDQLSAVLAAEHPALSVYAFDPGDMRTDMHQAAFPGEDISDRPEPETVVPALLRLLDERPPSARYRAGEFATAEAAR